MSLLISLKKFLDIPCLTIKFPHEVFSWKPECSKILGSMDTIQSQFCSDLRNSVSTLGEPDKAEKLLRSQLQQ